MRHAHHVSVLRRVWQYFGLGASSIVLEETNPIFGGIAARHGRWNLLAVIVACAIGTWIASLALYYIGYARIGWVKQRWPEKEPLLDAALDIVRKHPWLSAMSVRFAYGLRLPMPIACGAAEMPLRQYAIASGISSWAWALLFAYLGFAFGGAARRIIQITEDLDVRLGLLALGLAAVLFFLRWRRKSADRRSPDDPEP